MLSNLLRGPFSVRRHLPETAAEIERWATQGLIGPVRDTSVVDDVLASVLAAIRTRIGGDR